MIRDKQYIYYNPKTGRQIRFYKDVLIQNYNQILNETNFDEYSDLSWLKDEDLGQYMKDTILQEYEFVGIL